jgi:hypothetical protein
VREVVLYGSVQSVQQKRGHENRGKLVAWKSRQSSGIFVVEGQCCYCNTILALISRCFGKGKLYNVQTWHGNRGNILGQFWCCEVFFSWLEIV